MEKNIKWNTADGHSPVNAFFNSIAPISPQAMRAFDLHTFPVQIKKNKLLLKPGSVADHFYFIVRGVVRGYIKEEGRQITTWIVAENEIIGDGGAYMYTSNKVLLMGRVLVIILYARDS